MRYASGTRLAHTEPGLPRPIDDSDGTGRLTPSRCCEFVDSRLRRSPPDRASAVPYGQAGETQCVSPTLPTGRRLPTSFTVPPRQDGMNLFRGMVKPAP